MQITNIKQLTESLAENYVKLVEKKLNPAYAKELTNTAGKMINACKVQLEYNQFMQRKEKIEFLES